MAKGNVMSKITIAQYNDKHLTKCVNLIGSFDSVEEAVQYRDTHGMHNTKLENLGRNDAYTPVEMMNIPASSLDCSVDYSHSAENGWTATPEGWLYND
jgi:hypothetical protein